MNVYGINALKEAVEKKLGRKILSSSDCSSLSEDIFKQINTKISFNTLRRFFGLMKAKHQPSLFTLNILSNYCGFSSFNDFTANKQIVSKLSDITGTGLLDYAVLLFKNINVTSIDDITFINLVHETINYLEQYPDIIDQFQRQIAKTRNGQYFYFEQFVNIDKLNSFYGDGLHYYLNEKKMVQGRLFAHSLLCFRSWLTMDKNNVEKHYNEVMKVTIDKTFHPFTCGRYFATQLYFTNVCGTDIEPVLVNARQFYATLHPSKNISQAFPCFEYILAKALTLIQQYDEALFYIDEAIKKRANYAPPHIHFQLFESIYLYQAITLARIGKVERAKHILDTINTNNFYFLSKKFNTILYLLLKKSLQKKDILDKQLQFLVEQTGFKKLVADEPKVMQIVNEQK